MILATEKLDEVRNKLKLEFDGIDEIIDRVIDILSGWGSKRQLDKPIVVPIFGLTGTGKTSLVKRLVELLDLNHKFYPVTFGTSNDSEKESRPASILLRAMGFYDYDNSTSITDIPNDCILLLDDAHKCRTVDEDGNEETSEITEFFEIMDSGKLLYVPVNSSDLGRLVKWHDLLHKILLPDLGDAIVENALTTDVRVMDKLNSFHYLEDNRKDLIEKMGMTVPSNIMSWKGQKLKSYYEDCSKSLSTPIDLKFELGINPETGEDCLSLAPFGRREYLRDMLTELSSMDSIEKFLSFLRKKQTVKEFLEKLGEIIMFIKKPHYIDFSESLIFVTGNLDEAFEVAGELDPDVDADLYYKITSQVNITDIKAALLERFRPEQVARLGNNPIIYPSFSKETFKKIVNRYVKSDFDKYSNVTGIKLTYDTSIIDLIYSEGVFPTQGTRSILSTVGSLGIVFSRIDYLERTWKEKIKEVEVSAKPDNGNSKFNCSKAVIILNITVEGKADKLVNTLDYRLTLGSLRDPSKDKNRYAKAVHEMGHALAMLLETGKNPSSIITTSSSNSGGFCLRNIEEIDNKKGVIESPEMLRANIRIALAGWVSERVVFEEEEFLQLLGSSVDISEIWKDISYALYKGGLSIPIAFGDGTYPDGVPLGIKDESIMESAKTEITIQLDKIKGILEEYKPLIAYMAEELADKGSFSSEEFDDCLRKRAKNYFHEDTLIDGKDIVDRFLDLVAEFEKKRATLEKYKTALEKVKNSVKENNVSGVEKSGSSFLTKLFHLFD